MSRVIQCIQLTAAMDEKERTESFMIQDQMIDLEIDTGATVSVINENTYRQLKNSTVLKC